MSVSKLLPALLFTFACCCIPAASRAADDDDVTAGETPKGELYSLSYKFKAGEEIRWQTLHRATIKTTIRGTSQTAQTSTDSFKRWKISEVSPEGVATFVHLVDQVKMVNKISNRAEVMYDSAKDKQVPPGYENVAAAIGVPLAEIEMDSHGKVTRRTQKLVQPKGNFEPPIAIPLPAEPVAIGAVWTEPHQITVQLADKRKKAIAVRRRFELLQVNNDVAHISVSFQMLEPLDDPAIEAQIIQHSSQGEIRFDIERGRMLSQAVAVDKRVLGFSGPASSMHYLMRLNETLADPTAELANRPAQPAEKSTE